MNDVRDEGLVERGAGEAHLTASELRDFATTGGMTDAERIRALTHAAGCDACRARIAGLLRRSTEPLPAFDRAVTPPTDVMTAPRTGRQIVDMPSPPSEGGARHLTYAEITGLVGDTLSGVERDLVEGHMDGCAACRAAVEDQQAFVESIREAGTLPPLALDDPDGSQEPFLQGLVDRLTGALSREVRVWYRRQREDLRGFLPAAGVLTAAAAGEEAGEGDAGDTRLIEIWEMGDEASGLPAGLAPGLLLRLSRRGDRYSARVEYAASEGDLARERYTKKSVHLVILDAAGNSVFQCDILVGSRRLLGELELTAGATVLATVAMSAAPGE